MAINDKKRISEIFKLFQKEGFVAKESFTCCHPCAWGVLSDYPESQTKVFYAQCDAKSFNSSGKLRTTLFLGWEGDGHKIQKIIEDNGYKVNWDGTTESEIGILPNA